MLVQCGAAKRASKVGGGYTYPNHEPELVKRIGQRCLGGNVPQVPAGALNDVAGVDVLAGRELDASGVVRQHVGVAILVVVLAREGAGELLARRHAVGGSRHGGELVQDALDRGGRAHLGNGRLFVDGFQRKAEHGGGVKERRKRGAAGRCRRSDHEEVKQAQRNGGDGEEELVVRSWR